MKTDPLLPSVVYKRLRCDRESRLATEEGCQSPPRGDLMPRRFNEAIDRSVRAPSARMECRIETRLCASWSAAAAVTARPWAPASARLVGLPRGAPGAFFGSQAALVRLAIT